MASNGPAQVKILKTSGELYYAFRLNPSRIDRGRENTFADIALAQHDGGADAAGNLWQWTGTRAQSIELDFILHSVGAANVEADIATIERMMQKDSATGRPVLVLFVEGSKTDVVTVASVHWSARVWTPDLKRQIVDCRATLRVHRPYKPS